MKHLPTFVIVLLWPFLSWSQVNPTGQVHGRILDADTRLPLFGASVALILARDSSMSSFSALSSESGGFSISGVTADRYRLYISYLGYQPLLIPRVIAVDGKSIAFGDVLLDKKGLTLRQVEIITSKSPFTVKRDTIEYNADFYKTRETSPMEDLLRKLPGVEITPDGKIKVNGQAVDHVLIDGKSFFGTDTRQATQNLLVKIIDKIQVIDRVPDISEQSVPNNNATEKVINIILKKEEHNKIGGTINAAYGYKDRYSAKANLNRFGEKQQLSLIGGGNNINEFDNNNYYPKNIIRTLKAGANFNQKLNEKFSAEASYYTSDIQSKASSHSQRYDNVVDSILTSNSISDSRTHIMMHGITLKLSFKLDSMSNMDFSNSSSIKSNIGTNEKVYNMTGPNSLINHGSLVNSQKNNSVYQNSGLNYTRKFSRKGQILRLGLGFSNNSNRDDIHTISDTWYQLNVDLSEKDSLNQMVNNKESRGIYKLNIWYSHPLPRSLFMDFSLSSSWTVFKMEKGTNNFNKTMDEFNFPVDSLSGQLRNKSNITNGSIALRLNKAEYDLSIGFNGFLNCLDGWLKDAGNIYRKQYRNISPVVAINYQINDSKKFHFDYIQNMRAPEPTQLLLIPDRSNPLFLQKGNMDLKPTKVDQFNANYSSLNPVSMKVFSVLGNLEIVKDQVMPAITYDSIGRQVSIPVNISGAYLVGLNIYNSFSLGKKVSALNTSTAISVEKEFTYINSELTQVLKTKLLQGLNISWHCNNFLDLNAYGTLSFFRLNFGDASQLTSQYFETFISIGATLNLPHKVLIQSNINYTAAAGRANGFNNKQTIINIAVTKDVLKEGNGMIKLQSFDLLDQNASLIRNYNVGYIEDVKSLTMKRFVMIGFVYYIK